MQWMNKKGALCGKYNADELNFPWEKNCFPYFV